MSENPYQSPAPVADEPVHKRSLTSTINRFRAVVVAVATFLFGYIAALWFTVVIISLLNSDFHTRLVDPFAVMRWFEYLFAHFVSFCLAAAFATHAYREQLSYDSDNSGPPFS